MLEKDMNTYLRPDDPAPFREFKQKLVSYEKATANYCKNLTEGLEKMSQDKF